MNRTAPPPGPDPELGTGVTLGIDAIPSVEQIAANFGKIADLTGAQEYESAGANVPKLMAGLFGTKR